MRRRLDEIALRAALTDPEPSLNHSGGKIVRGICTGKRDLIGFMAHMHATIGRFWRVRSEKLF
jgi:hypothetical protein